MAPSEYAIRLQHGITGGFAPPTPSEVHMLTRSSQKPSVLMVQSHVRADGTPELSAAAPKELAADDHAALVEELEGILKSLPVESPPGSEDIYGLDTSIMFGSSDLEWMNGGPQGCGGGESSVKASAEDKKKFERAVAIVKELSAA